MSGKAWCCWMFTWVAGLGLLGCDKLLPQKKVTPRPAPRQLLKIPTAQLLPTRSPMVKAELQLPVSDVAEIRISLKKSSSSPKRLRLFRYEKQWWVVKKLEEDNVRLALFPGFSVKKWLGELKGLKNLTPKLGQQPAVENELLLFSKRGQPLLRMMHLASKQKDNLWPGRSWQLYRQGSLFQQDAEGSLSSSLRILLKDIRGLSRRSRWMALPQKSWNWTSASLFRIGGGLAAHRQALKSCFKKRTFPSHVGTLKIQVFFDKNGQVKKKKMRLKTRAHVKYGLVWCIWNKVKHWKLKSPTPEFEYFLLLPPKGP